LLIISFLTGIFSYSQTISSDTISGNKQQMFISVDLLNPVAGFFSYKKSYSGFVSYKIKNKWAVTAEIGYEKNSYKKNNWDVEAKGIFGEAGVNYMLTNNPEDTGEGFYIGARIGFSPYKQKVKKYPVKEVDPEGHARTVGGGSLSEAGVSSGWIEAVVGAKVQLGKTPFYIDFMAKPKFLIFSGKQENIDNLVIPGYGKDKGAANISLYWGIGYKLF
jgi:hypothetical protein